jgi:hypothetical protein
MGHPLLFRYEEPEVGRFVDPTLADEEDVVQDGAPISVAIGMKLPVAIDANLFCGG